MHENYKAHVCSVTNIGLLFYRTCAKLPVKMPMPTSVARATNQPQNQPWVEIIEQPSSKATRYVLAYTPRNSIPYIQSLLSDILLMN